MSSHFVSLCVAAVSVATTSVHTLASDALPAETNKAAQEGFVNTPAQPSATPAPNLDAPVSTTLRKINRMLTSAYYKGFAAGLNGAAQAEGSQDDIRDVVRQATPPASRPNP